MFKELLRHILKIKGKYENNGLLVTKHQQMGRNHIYNQINSGS